MLRKLNRGLVVLAAATALSATRAFAADPTPAEIDAIFAAAQQPGAPGCVVGVVRDGAFVYKRAYGLADLERHVPLTTQTAFNIASAAKQFTAAVVAQLAREKRLSLDDSIRRHVPELPPYHDPVTVRHLIHHTSGLRDYPTLLAMGSAPDAISERQFLRLMARQQALNFAPGAEFLYSNSNYVMLGVIVRRVTGKGLREYADEVIFRPLGMTGTRFQENRTALIPNRAIPYSPLGQTFRVDGDTADNLLPPVAPAAVGDGSLFTTIDDLVGWARYLEGPNGKELFEVGALSDGTRLDYAFGLVQVRTPGGIPFVAHGGNSAAYRAAIAHYPEQKLTVASFCNNGALAPQDLATRVSALFLPPVPPLRPAPVAPAPPAPAASPQSASGAITITAENLEAFTGAYYSSEVEGSFEIVRRDTLRLVSRTLDVELVPVAADRFVWSSWTLDFIRTPAGAISGFALTGTRARGIRFSRLP